MRAIQIHHDWVTSVWNNKEPLFNERQLNMLQSYLSPRGIRDVQEIVKTQLDSPIQKLVEIIYPPIRILIAKEQTPPLIALSTRQSDLLDSTQEDQLSDGNTAFIVQSQEMKRVMEIIKKVSYVDSTVLLLGKSGVGKGAIAKLIHTYSHRVKEPFVCINCGAIPEHLMEAELFGYEPGSFTGGRKEGKKGLFEATHGGTIFLDEVGELPFNLQVKLLEVLQENHIRRIGGTQSMPIDVRIVAATNQDLARLVQLKAFREDLYYRLNVVPIEIPPLKERKEDIENLADFFIKKYSLKYSKFKTIHPEVTKAFKEYEWPGNVRELENMIERLTVTTEEEEIGIHHLPPGLFSRSDQPMPQIYFYDIIPFKQAKKLVEKELVSKAFKLYKNTYKMAESLGVDQSTIVRKMKEFRIREEVE